MIKKTTVLLVGILFISCNTRIWNAKVQPDLKRISSRELLAQNEQWQKSITSLKGSARITLDSPQYSGNFGADILMNRKDSLLITITGPVGIKLGKAFLGPNRFVFYNQMMNQFMTGSLDDYEDTNFMQFPLEVSQLRNVFAAQENFNILKLSAYEIRDHAYFLIVQNDHLQYHLWFDPASLLIKRIEYYDGKKLLYYKTYGQFEKINGIYFPKMINFVRPGEKQALSIYYETLELNQPLPAGQFDIKISDSAKQIELSVENSDR